MSDGAWSNHSFVPPQGMSRHRYQELEVGVARGYTAEQMRDRLAATEGEMRLVLDRLERCR